VSDGEPGNACQKRFAEKRDQPGKEAERGSEGAVNYPVLLLQYMVMTTVVGLLAYVLVAS
jgi:hypothetical protein